MTNITELKFDKWVDILLFIKEEGTHTSDIGIKLGITWSHVSGVTKLLAEKNLINRQVNENNMRIKSISLTKKGQRVQELLKEVKKILNENGKTEN